MLPTSSFWSKKGRKALKIKGWRAPSQLVDPHRDPHGERAKECRTGNLRFLSGFFSLPYMTCAMKFPMVAAASSCFCRVAWVWVRRINPAS